MRSGTPQTQGIKNYEVGYRVQTPEFYGVVSLWHRNFTGVPFQQFLPNGESITATYGSVATGTDFESRYQPIEHLTFDLRSNWQHATYSAYNSASGGDYTGLELQRRPKLQFRITPGYEFPMDWGGLRFFATYTHVGLRYSDIANPQVLPSYYTLDAGAVAEIGHNVEIRVQGTNLTNQLGLTEGNNRLQVGSGISNNIEMVRPLFGRKVNIQLRYKF